MVAAASLADLAFAAFHLAFWRLFGWPASLRASGCVNAAVTQVMNLALIFVFAAYGGVLLGAWLAGTSPHAAALAVGAAFWVARAAVQPLFFPLRDPRSLAFTAACLVAALLHVAAAWER
jgi:hypothetical protein